MATNQVIDWQRKEVAERAGLFAAAPRILRFAPDRRVRVVQNRCAILSNPVGSSTHPAPPNKKGLKTGPFYLAERVGFEPTCRNYPTIRFRVGAVMTTSVPLRLT